MNSARRGNRPLSGSPLIGLSLLPDLESLPSKRVELSLFPSALAAVAPSVDDPPSRPRISGQRKKPSTPRTARTQTPTATAFFHPAAPAGRRARYRVLGKSPLRS